MDKTLEIKCTGEFTVDWKQLKDLQLTEDGRSLKATDDAKIDKLASSLLEYGLVNPLQVWIDGDDIYCFDAHHRKMGLAILEREGVRIPPIPATQCLASDKNEAKKLLLIKESKSSWVDIEVIGDYLAEIGMTIELASEAVDLPEIEWENVIESKLDEGGEYEGDADAVPDVRPETDTKLGDLFILGNHRVMCGDSTDKEQVERLMDGRKADMVFTDPPYGVNIKGGSKSNKTIAGDLTQVAIPFSFDVAVETATKDDARFYFCGSEGNLGLYDKLFDRFLSQLPRHIIWVKNGFVMKPNNYHNQYEVIYFGYKPKGGGLDHWFSGRTEDEASDVWKIKRDPASSYQHPTQKPTELAQRAIKNSSPVLAIVYDAFLGSGSTLIACEQTNRVCFGMEIDPHYVDVIVKRWEEFTGKKAQKVPA